MDDFLNALRFLTRLPVPGITNTAAANSPEQVPWYGMVGFSIGLVLCAVSWLLNDISPMVSAALVLIVWIWITGALHLDGLADCGDAWMSGTRGVRFLEILRDVQCGAGALVWVVAIIVTKFAALSVLLGFDQWLGLLFVPVMARIAVQVAVFRVPYARPAGLGAPLHNGVDGLMTLAVSGGLLLALGVISLPALADAILATALAFGLVYVMLVRRAGGFTGDIYGALIEISETSVLVALALTFQ